MKVAGYLRVSTDRQAEQGLGLDVQEASIRKWARAHGHRVTEWYRDEGQSGSNGVETRSGLHEALAAVKDRRVGGLVVAKLDRLARTLSVQEAVLAQVWQHGGKVFAADFGEILQDDPDDPMRTAMRQMMGVFAQLERAMIHTRMRDGRRLKQQRGGYAYGAPPLGYQAKDRALVSDETEQKTLARIRELRKEGKSLRQMAEILTAEGHPTKRGKQWHPETLRLILNRLEGDQGRKRGAT